MTEQQDRISTGNAPSERVIGRPILLGFAAVTLILVILMGISLVGMRDAQTTLRNMSANHHKIFKKLYEMQYAARERVLLLQAALYTDDEGEREENIQAFYDMGEYFARARGELMNLDFTPGERELLRAQRLYAEQLRPLEEQVITMMLGGRRDEARHLLQYSIVPNQTEMIFVLGNLFEKKLEKLDSRVDRVREEIERYSYILWAAGSGGVLLILVIGVTVMRRSSLMYAALRNSARELAESLQELEVQKQAVDLHNIVSVTDADGNITYVNDKFTEVSQYSRDELIGKNHRILKSGMQDDAFYAAMWQEISQGKVWHGEVCNRRKDGTLYWVTTTILPFVDERDVPYKYVAVITDVTTIKEAEQVLQRDTEALEALVEARTRELTDMNLKLEREIEERKQLEAELKKMATTDPLTGVLNRRSFSEIFNKEIMRARRYSVPLSLILFDIDHFKKINDRFGHQAGDEVLRAVTRCVGEAIRDLDVLARWGGEEFIVLTPDCDRNCARELAARLCRTIAALAIDEVGAVTCSFGIASYTEGDDMDSMVERADRNLYAAKSGGRNRVCG